MRDFKVNLEEAKLKLSKYGQEQILRYYDELSDDEKNALLEQIDKTDMEVCSVNIMTKYILPIHMIITSCM